MFALSDSQPTSYGFVSRVDPTYGDLLEAGFNLGKESNAVGYASRAFDNFLASDGNLASLARQELGRDPVNLLPPEELNKRYSLPGLTFDQPTTDEMAKLMHERQKRLIHYQYLTSELPTMLGGLPAPGTGFSKSLAAFGANVAGSLSNPLDFALTFTPWFGEAKAATWLGKGLVSAERLPFVARFPEAMPAIMNNLVSQTLIELPRAVGDIQETGSPDFKGIAADIVVGGAVAEGLRQAGKMIVRMSENSYNAAIRKAITDAESGRPIDVSANVLQDPNVVRADVEATLRAKTEAEIRETDWFKEKVKPQVEAILKDRAELERRLEIVKKSEMLSDADAMSMVRDQVTKEFGSVYAAAEAQLRVSGHLGKVTREGARLLAQDFLDFVQKLPDDQRAPFEERYARVGLILREVDSAKRISDSAAVRLAKELGLEYDWRSQVAPHLPTSVDAAPKGTKDALGVVLKVDAKKGSVISYRATDEALRNRLGNDILAREELISSLTNQELERRVVEHAKALQQEYAKLAGDQSLNLQRRLASPELNTWIAGDDIIRNLKDSPPPEDLRLRDEKQVKNLDKPAEVSPEDATAETALEAEALKELEGLGDLTEEEKAYIDAVPDNESEDFVKSVVESATDCIIGKDKIGK